MSTPTRPIGVERSEDVRAYIGTVRAWLADLPAEDVDDLTLGMEADLSERAAEGDVRLGDLLGEPEVYAAELRAAAGLPPRSAQVATASSARAGSVVVSLRQAGDRLLGRFPWLVDLRPVWWVARGVVAGWAVAMVLGTGHSVLLPAVAAALSFVLGRWTAKEPVARGVAAAVVAGNVLAALLFLPAAVWYLDGRIGDSGSSIDSYSPPAGLRLDGDQVQNLYVYDAQGNRVEGARVFADDGQAVVVDPTMSDWGPDGLPYRADGTVDVATDVFPLVVGDRDPWADPQTGWTPPLTLPPLPVVPSPGAVATPTPSSSASPTSAPSPSMTPAP